MQPEPILASSRTMSRSENTPSGVRPSADMTTAPMRFCAISAAACATVAEGVTVSVSAIGLEFSIC